MSASKIGGRLHHSSHSSRRIRTWSSVASRVTEIQTSLCGASSDCSTCTCACTTSSCSTAAAAAPVMKQSYRNYSLLNQQQQRYQQQQQQQQILRIHSSSLGLGSSHIFTNTNSHSTIYNDDSKSKYYQIRTMSNTVDKNSNDMHDSDSVVKDKDEANETNNSSIDDVLSPLSEVSSSDMEILTTQTTSNEEEDTPTTTTSNTTVNSIDVNSIPGTSAGKSRKLAILYTCNVCNTRSAKRFTERAYNHGVVLIRCPNCQSLHLIADRMGYFTDKDEFVHDGVEGSEKNKGRGWDIEMFMKSIGQEDNVRVMSEEGSDVLEVTMEDLVGKDRMEDLHDVAKASSAGDIASDKQADANDGNNGNNDSGQKGI